MPLPAERDEPAPIVPEDASALPMPGWLRESDPEAAALAAALRTGAWAPGGRMVKVEGGAFTFLGLLEMGGRVSEVVLKRVPHPPGALAPLRLTIAGTKAQRQCVGAWRLARRGARVSRPLALLRGVQDKRGYDWLLLERLPGRDLIHCLGEDELSVREQHETANRAGELVRMIAASGLFNRDHKLSNQILLPGGGVGLVDTVAIRRARAGGDVRMLRSMLFEGAGTGVLPRRAVLMRCLRAAVDDPKSAWREMERALARAGDTAPRVDPRHGAVT